MTEVQKELAHMLTKLDLSVPAWLEYAENKARGLERKYPALYAGLPAMLAESLSSRATNTASTDVP